MNVSRERVIVHLPLRIDLAMGGISDLPEWSSERPGGAFGLAAKVYDGKQCSRVTVESTSSDDVQVVLRRWPLAPIRCNLRADGNRPIGLDLIVRSIAVALRWPLDDLVTPLSHGSKQTLKITVELPLTKGLGSSTVTACGIIVAIRRFFDMPVVVDEVVSLGQEADRAVGTLGGWEDSIPALLGNATVTFSSPGQPPKLTVERLHVGRAIQSALVLCDTKISATTGRVLETALENFVRRKEMVVEKSKCLLDEVQTAAGAVKRSDWSALGASLDRQAKAWASITSGLSMPNAVQKLQDLVRTDIYGCKPAGAGGGGVLIFACKPERRMVVQKNLQSAGCDILKWTVFDEGMVV